MPDYEFHEIGLDDLMDALGANVKEDIKSFEDVLNLDGALNREIYLRDIEEGTGINIEGFIRFWNDYDRKKNIPVENRKPIKLYIDSNGGLLDDTLTIIDAIKMSVTPVWTINLGKAYSGGFFTFIAGTKRIAYPHASFLFHEGSTGTSGTSGQFENYTAFYKKQLEQIKDHVLECTSLSEEEYTKIRKEDIWYTAQEALEKGIVDEIARSLDEI